MQETTVDAVAIRRELDRLLASPAFAGSGRLKHFLQYIVEETLSGRGEEIKETTVGVAIYGKQPDYDPRIDASVRTDALRLRSRLRDYYAAEGQGSAVIIDVPKGRYVPVFRVAETAPAVPRPTRTFAGHRRLAVLLLSGAVLIVAGAAFRRHIWRTTETTRPVLRQLTSDVGVTWQPTLSRDGSFVAYASDRGSNNLNLWFQAVASRDALQLTDHPADDYDPVFAPDGSRIAFRSDRDGGGIYVMPSVGGDAKLVSKGGRRPQFSPDGSMIAYAVDNWRFLAAATGSGRIFVIPASGGVPQQLVPQFASAHFPIWAPDGEHILFLGKKDESPPPKDTVDWWVTSIKGGAAIRTGVFSKLRQHKLQIPAWGNSSWAPYGWSGDSVLFPARLGDSDSLWKIRLARATWQVAGEAQIVSTGAGFQVHASAADTGSLAFTQLSSNYEIASLPAPGGPADGQTELLTTNSAMDHWPALSPEGTLLAFMSWRLGNPDIWVRNLATGDETAVTRAPVRATNPAFTPDGKHVIYHASGTNARSVWRVTTTGESPEKLCEHCSYMGLTQDGKKLLYSDWEPTRVVLRTLADGTETEILRYPNRVIYQPLLTRDDRWVAFYEKLAPERTRIYVAPFRYEGQVPEQLWIPLTDGKSHDTAPVWSGGEDLLYFASDRDGYACIWARKVDRLSRQPVGAEFAVAHFHSPAQRLGNPGVVNRALAVSKDRIVFPVEQLSGNIWMLHH